MKPPPPHSITLHEDVVVEILSWLPVQSLAQFRCVSKSMKSLISDPSFLKLHLQRSPKDAKVLLLKLHKDSLRSCVLSFSLPLLKNPSFTIAEDLGFGSRLNLKYNEEVVGSCNGLICSVNKNSKRNLHKEYQVSLWNPATKLRSQKLPCLIVPLTRTSYHYTNQRILNTIFGFGYDSLSDTYKVVAIISYMNYGKTSFETEVKVCNKGGNCWKNIQSFSSIPYLTQQYGAVYLSGSVSWLASNIKHYRHFPLYIGSLDLGKETYRKLSLPCGFDEVRPMIGVANVVASLGVMKDCLCFSHDFKETHFVVWQMKEFGVENSWTALLNISYIDLHMINDMGAGYLIFPKLHMLENGGILLVMAGGGRTQAILYNLIDRKMKHIEISNNILEVYSEDYVQSLVSPY